MMWALAWKESREHALVWLALLALTLMAVIGLPVALKSEGADALRLDDLRALALAVLATAAVYGLVCGSMMLAGETEGGTLEFLDAQAGRRAGVWRSKLISGVLLVLAHSLAAGAVAAVIIPSDPLWPRWAWLVALPAITLDAFAWGMLGSALCRSTMAAVGVGGVLTAITLVPSMAIFFEPGGWKIGALVRAFLALLALAGSALAFCRNDLGRSRSRTLVTSISPTAPARGGWRSLIWLTLRQARGELLVLLVAAILAGLALKFELLAVWGVATTLFGVLCGSGVFTGEQRGGYQRFLGDQRLPLGRVWLVKLLVWSGALLLILAIMALGGLTLLVEFEIQKGPSLKGGPEMELLKHIILASGFWMLVFFWALHGFAFGQFCAFLFNKSVVAVVLALMLTGCVTALWTPSLLTGGLKFWQVLGLPLLLLAATRLLMWAWATQGLSTRRAWGVLLGCVAAGLLWLGLALGMRMWEVPSSAPPIDLMAWQAKLPAGDANKAADHINSASLQIDGVQKRAAELIGMPANVPRTSTGDVSLPQNVGPWPHYRIHLLNAPSVGMPQDTPEFERFLDEVFKGEWYASVQAAAPLPISMLIQPRTVAQGGHRSVHTSADGLRYISHMLVARCYQLQAKGDHAGALEQLDLLFMLSRHARHYAPGWLWFTGFGLEGSAQITLEKWLEKAPPEPGLLKKASDMLARHVNETPAAREVAEFGYAVAHARLQTPEHSFGEFMFYQGTQHPKIGGYLTLLAALHRVPWEKQRITRLNDAVFDGRLRGMDLDYQLHWQLAGDGPPGMSQSMFVLAGWVPPTNWGADAYGKITDFFQLVKRSWLIGFADSDFRLRSVATSAACRVAATQLQLALRRYEVDKGELPETLDELLPTYLPWLPKDPYSGRHFKYVRVTAEEGFNVMPGPYESVAEPITLAPGDGVLWSVGPDGTDHGGHVRGNQLSLSASSGHQVDWVFLVRRVHKKP